MKEAETLVEAGYQVSILGWDRTGELPANETTNSISIYRLPIRSKYGTGMGNLPNLLRWQFGLFAWLFRHRNDFDLIHACDFDTVLPGLVWKWLHGGKLIYDIFDFYADHLRNTPEWIKSTIRTVDLWAIDRADAVILADDARTSQISGAAPRRCAVIYNSPPDETIEVVELPSGSRGPGLHLGYVGLLQVERGILELLQVMERHPEWTMDMAGYGGDEDVILPLIDQLDNVTWLGRIPYDRAMAVYQSADVLFATYDPIIPNHRYSSPNKVFEAMMLGKPIIVAEETNMDRIINESGSGLVVPYGDPEALEAALVRLQKEPELRVRLGENGRKAYEKVYGWDTMAKRLRNLYQAVLEGD